MPSQVSRCAHFGCSPSRSRLLSAVSSRALAEGRPLEGVRRVVFLGDSITYSGRYVEYVEAFLRASDPALRCEFLDLGLPSETVSGLSEPGHAGGKFPRPDLHERLGRVLERTKPDLVVACYGMNDGIYHPYADKRFREYQDGIRRLRETVLAAGAKLIVVTPPVFDPVPLKGKTLPAGRDEYRAPYANYNEVLDLYAAWLLAERGDGWEVVDAHGPMNRYLAEKRRLDPNFRLADDGVHIDDTGHWLVARPLLIALGITPAKLPETETAEKVLGDLPHGPALLKLVERKQRLLKDAWLTTTGHNRPGMARGVPLEDAEREAAVLDAEIVKLQTPRP